MKTEEEIEAMLELCLKDYDAGIEKNGEPGNYASAVRDALDWVLGQGDPPYGGEDEEADGL